MLCVAVCPLDSTVPESSSQVNQSSHSQRANHRKSVHASRSNLQKNTDHEDEATLTKEWLKEQIHYFKIKSELLVLEKEHKLKEMDAQLENLHAQNKKLHLQNKKMEIDIENLREMRQLEKRELELRVLRLEHKNVEE